jgi:probable O-glycosylation ligase (exosortase A-associated)
VRDLFVTLAVFGSLPMILYRPYIGVLVWSWIGYMNPHRLCWGFATQFPFAMIVAITTLVAILFSRESKKIPMTREVVVLLLFIAWMGVTTLTALHPELAQTEYTKILKIELMTFVTMMLMTDRRRIELLVWVIALSLGFYGVKGGIFTIISGGGYHVMGPSHTFIGGNNEIGLALIMTIPLMRYLYLQTSKSWQKWGLMAAMGLTVVAILGTQSRGALLGLAVMGAMLIWKTRRRFVLFFVMGAVLFAGISFMPGSWHERMESIRTYHQDQSAMGRINAWRFAFNLAKARPLVGGGNHAFTPDLFARYAPDPTNVHDAHSIYFEVLGEHGFVGLALFLLLGWFAWRSCSLAAKQVKSNPNGRWVADLAKMLQVSMVGYATSGAFLGLAYFDLYYHMIALVVLVKVQSQQLAEQEKLSAGREKVHDRGLQRQAGMVGRLAGK